MRRALITLAVLVIVAGGGVVAWQVLRSRTSQTAGHGAGPGISSGSSVVSGQSGLYIARAPSKQSLDALDTISQPSLLSPLPHSQPGTGSPTAYTIAETCAQVVAAYHDRKALPQGAHVRSATPGTLLIADRYDDLDGLVYHSQPHGCDYTLLSQPPVVVTGSSPVPAGSYWSPVGCADLFGTGQARGIEATAFTASGVPYVVYVGTQDQSSKSPPLSTYDAFVARATVQQLQRSGGRAGTPYPVQLSTTPDGSVRAVLGGAAAGQTITLTCSSNLGDVLSITGH